jgi:WD40 repeat protein
VEYEQATSPEGEPSRRRPPDVVIAGTPEYMAPEQARGDSKLTVAVDVYGLGAVLYELLTGQPPFRGPNREETRRQVREERPVSPRARDRRVPRDLSAICMKCLHKDPERRYGSAAALAEDLRRFLAREPVEARPVGRSVRLFMWARRQPAPAALGALVALLAVALVVVGGWWLWRLSVDHERDQWRLYAHNVDRANQFILVGHFYQAREALEECPANLRGWDWYYLDNLCRQGLRLEGHEQAVESVRYSPCGKYVLTGGHDGTARLWDARTGALLRTFDRHRPGRVTAQFTDNGRLVVSAGQEQDVFVRERDTGKVVLHLVEAGACFACDIEGRHLAVIDSSQKLRLFALPGGREVGVKQLGSLMIALTFSPDGKTLAMGGFKRMVELLDVDTLKVTELMPPTRETVWALAFSPDGRYLAAGLGRPVLWDLKTLEVATLQGTGMFHCNSLAFSHDSSRLAGTYRDGFVRVWEVEDRVLVRGPPRLGEMANDAVFSPDGMALAITRGRAVVVEPFLRDVETNCPLGGHCCEELESVAIGPGGDVLASLGGDEVLVYSLYGGLPTRYEVERAPAGQTWRYLRIQRDGRILIASVDRGAWGLRITLRELSGAKIASVTVAHEVQSLAFDDRDRLFVGDSTGQVHRWDWESGETEIKPVDVSHGKGSVTALAISRNGKLLATGGMDLTIQLWRNGKLLHTLKLGHEGPPASLAFTPDNKRLVSGGSDGRLVVWDVASGQKLFELSGHNRKVVSAVAFDRDGNRLVTCGYDGIVRIWDGTPQQRR